MQINIDWLKKNHQMIHYFGLGFIQLKVSQNERLHFYTEKLPSIVDEEDVHNHRYDFTSEIVSGSLLQKIYEVDFSGDNYVMLDESCNVDKPSSKESIPCGIKLVGSQLMTKRSYYWTHHKTFHKVKASNCITHILRTGYKQEFAQVIHEKGIKPICPFSRKIEESHLWEIVEDMIKENSTELSKDLKPKPY